MHQQIYIYTQFKATSQQSKFTDHCSLYYVLFSLLKIRGDVIYIYISCRFFCPIRNSYHVDSWNYGILLILEPALPDSEHARSGSKTGSSSILCILVLLIWTIHPYIARIEMRWLGDIVSATLTTVFRCWLYVLSSPNDCDAVIVRVFTHMTAAREWLNGTTTSQNIKYILAACITTIVLMLMLIVERAIQFTIPFTTAFMKPTYLLATALLITDCAQSTLA